MHLKMISTLHNDDWLPHSDPFSPFGDMESEIAELKTMTRVTKLRQQIECRQEGSWMIVRDVPDNRAKSGTRKVTSYGRTSRSVTRSVSQNVEGLNFNSFLLDGVNGISKDNEVVIEYPSEEEKSLPPSGVEITEVLDEPKESEIEVQFVPEKTSPAKKTSVVTLGKGNLVLIDDEDSNFHVTGISKGKVADVVNTLERASGDKGEKKVKKVGFSKTEVHFAPDSGRVNIVETDEKPPPSQVLRRKKRPRNPSFKKSNLPKLYFGGDQEHSLETDKNETNQITEHKFPVIREPSPLLSTVVANLTGEKNEKEKEEKENEFYSLSSIRSLNSTPELKIFDKKETKFEKEKSAIGYLGNVSPKLSKLLQNNMEHEFQLKQKQIMNKIKPEPIRPNQTSVNIKFGLETDAEINNKSITQVNLIEEPKNETSNPTKFENNEYTEPLYINKDVIGEKKISRPIEGKEKTPKPKPRTSITKISVSTQKDIKPIKTPVTKSLERAPKRNPPKPKEVMKKEVQPVKAVKPYSRNLTSKQTDVVSKKSKIKSEVTAGSTRLQKLIKNTSEKTTEVRAKKPKEPLRSFEKVSNGWVGHCIVPVKSSPKTTATANVTLTTNVYSSSSASSHTQGIKRSTEPKALPRSNKPTLTSNKQFSLSKEHLKSAKLVKELSKDNKQEVKKPEVPKSRINVVRPHIVENKSSKTKSVVSRRRLHYEESYGRLRRDSDQSDDSVVRADEEVRAYMFRSRHKVFLIGAGTNLVEDGRSFNQ